MHKLIRWPAWCREEKPIPSLTKDVGRYQETDCETDEKRLKSQAEMTRWGNRAWTIS